MFYRLVLAALVTATLGFAQGRGGGMGEEGGMGAGGRGGGMGDMVPNVPRVMTRLDILTDQMKLDKDQRKNVKNILDDAQKEANPIRDQLVKARLAIGEAVQAGKSGEDLKPLVASEAALETKMTAIELASFVKIYKSLEAEQRNQSRVLFQMMKGLFENKNWNYMD